MEKVNEWVRTCLHKSRLSESIADKIIAKAKDKLYKYYCPHCFGWHLTKKERHPERQYFASVDPIDETAEVKVFQINPDGNIQEVSKQK
jgi:hypothetical protein